MAGLRLWVYAAFATSSALAGTVPSLEPGSIVELDDNTIFIVGEPLNVVEKQADVGNLILHRFEDTLYMIDSGALDFYRPIILEAAERLGDVEHVVLVNTHNHIDHTGNNDIIFEIPASSHRHFMSIEAKRALARQDAHFAESGLPASRYQPRIGDYVDAKAGRADYWEGLLSSFFDPRRTSLATVQPLESLPLQSLDIGGVREFGWNFDDAMYVLPTRGHTRGSVCIYFPHAKLLMLGDETNNHYHVFHDANSLATMLGFQRYLALIRAGHVRYLTDGHSFTVYSTEQAEDFIQKLIDDELRDQRIFLDVLRRAGRDGYTIDVLIEKLLGNDWWSRHYARLHTEAPFFIPFVVLRRLDEIGAERVGAAPNTRFRLRRP